MDKNNSTKKLVLLAVVLAVTITVALFYFIVYPILQFSVLGLTQHQGKDLFQEQTYLEFDHGEEFCNAVDSLGFVTEEHIVDFVYYNHCRQDHLLWGKYPDIYTLDVYVGENYNRIYTQFWDENAPTGGVTNLDVMLYRTEETGKTGNQLFLAFSEERQLVRILYRTGVSKKEMAENTVPKIIWLNRCNDLWEYVS